jgi:hypothetical protein
MSKDHRPLLPQLLILFRENEEQVEAEPIEIEPSAESNEARHRLGLRRNAPTRKAG